MWMRCGQMNYYFSTYFIFIFIIITFTNVYFLNQNSISADVEVCRNSQIINRKFLPKQWEQIVDVSSEVVAVKHPNIANCPVALVGLFIWKKILYCYHIRDCRYTERLLLPSLSVVTRSNVACLVWPYEIAIQTVVLKYILGSFTYMWKQIADKCMYMLIQSWKCAKRLPVKYLLITLRWKYVFLNEL